MPIDHRAALAKIKRFDQLIAYLRDEMGWPIARDSFDAVDDLFYDFTADELGIDPKTAAKIQEIKRLRPLSPRQPWGIFFVKFEPRKLPVVALRRILSQVATKKRASANSAERAAWAADDLLFVSNYGEGDERQISFAHFSQPQGSDDLPTLKVLGWDNRDTPLHLQDIADRLTTDLAWPNDDSNVEAWRERWRAAFTLRHREVISTSRELSIRLAALARAIRDRTKAALAIETPAGRLTKLMQAFKEALLHDLDSDGFADMYAQTIAYGLLSARIADPHKKTADDFAAHMRTNPFLRELMEAFLKVGGRQGKAGGPGIDFDELGVGEVVEMLDDPNTHMDAVVRDFGDRNPLEDPVIHFYEGFAHEYDPIDKVKRGEFYTPRPVVSYIVRSVHELLRTEFGLSDGLADTTSWAEMIKRRKDLKIPDGVAPAQDFVQILDPATGTGTFLVEVIDLIHKTLVVKWTAQGHGPKRIETLWNEYVPAHLLSRLHAYEIKMAPYAIAHLKIGLKLYETGYRFGSDERARIYLTNALEPASDKQLALDFLPALAHEAQAVNQIKRNRRFTVVIGNPPYSKSSSNRSEAAEALVADYKRLVRGETNVQPLSDDYVKFVAFAFQASIPRASLIGLITNRSYLEGLIHRGMRVLLCQASSIVFIVDLHGDSNVGEHPPVGRQNENVFDIMQGVAISIFVRSLEDGTDQVLRHDVWGTRSEKYQALGRESVRDGTAVLQVSEPYSFFVAKDLESQSEQHAWIGVDSLFDVAGMGVKSRRDHFLIDTRREVLKARLEKLATTTRVESIRAELDVTDNPQWTLAKMRDLVRREGVDDRIVAITYRPFDMRLIWYHREAIERGDARWPVMKNVLPDGLSLLTSRQSMNHDFSSAFVARGLSEMKTAESTRGSYVFPIRRADDSRLLEAKSHASNLRVSALGATLSPRTPEEILGYVYSVLYSASYRRRYAGALRIEFPKIPKDCPADLADELCRLGGELVALHLLESATVHNFITTYVGPRKPEVGRVGWSDNTVWLDVPVTKRGEAVTAGTVGFCGVPEAVWNFDIGGYQVCERWLKERRGGTLSRDDITHYQRIVVALKETIRLMQEIDDAIDRHGGWPDAFMTDMQVASSPVASFQGRATFSLISPDDERVKVGAYKTLLPVYSLKVAAGYFGGGEDVASEGWVPVTNAGRLDKGMFVARAVGRSMEPMIHDGDLLVFRHPADTHQGAIVLAQHRGAADPETGGAYTVKRYSSDKVSDGAEGWRHARITLSPLNTDFAPIVIPEDRADDFRILAEFVQVVTP